MPDATGPASWEGGFFCGPVPEGRICALHARCIRCARLRQGDFGNTPHIPAVCRCIRCASHSCGPAARAAFARAYALVSSQKGKIVTEAAYPYTSGTGRSGTCASLSGKAVGAVITGHKDVTHSEERGRPVRRPAQRVAVAPRGVEAAGVVYKGV